MMFLLHSAFFLGLIALSAGLFLYIWAVRNKGAGSGLAIVFGVIIIILSILDIVCLGYYGVKYWSDGYFQTPAPMMNMMQNKAAGAGGK